MIDATSRRSDQRSKIVEVAASLLREQGPTAVTTRGVAEGAGVQAPTIYRLFGDKDGLLDAVVEHVMATYASSKASIVEEASARGADPLDDLRAGWQAQVDFGVANPSLFALLSDPDRVLHSAAARTGRQVLESRIHRVAATGRLRVEEHHAVAIVQAAGIGVIHTLLSAPQEQRDAGLAESMYEAVLRQILTAVPAVPDDREDGARTTAIALRAVAPQLDVLSEAEQQLLVQWLDRVIEAATRYVAAAPR